MPGLDPNVVAALDQHLTLARIRHDASKDSLLSPQFRAIYDHLGDDLWGIAISELQSGTYQPRLPITLEMPKPTGITRPMSTLEPLDRLVYQALADVLAPTIEDSIDRAKVFSAQLIDPDPEGRMFEDASDRWQELQDSIEELCGDGRWSHAVRADVSSFYERVRQHALVNLLHASGCPSGAVNLLEELLLVWTERNSHGLLQGLAPSDLLGNFTLVGLDAELEVRGIPHLRYVDDLYLFFESEEAARRGLIDLCRYLRSEGLSLNPLKSRVMSAQDLLHEETQFDRMFETACEEVTVEIVRDLMSLYTFELQWDPDIDVPEDDLLQLRAVEILWDQLQDPHAPADKIRRFCLPAFAASGIDIALEDSLAGMLERPHLARHYARYLWQMARGNTDIKEQVERTAREGPFISDWQHMWMVTALYYMDTLEEETVSALARTLATADSSVLVRGLCVLAVGKHGTAAQRQMLRRQYNNECSDYVRAALVFSTQYFPAAERRTCLKAWGGQSRVNALIASAVRKIAA